LVRIISKIYHTLVYLNILLFCGSIQIFFSDYGWHGLSFIDSRIAFSASRDLALQYRGLNSSPIFSPAFLYLCGIEEFDISIQPNSLNFRIFQGHSGDAAAFSADVIFPGTTFVEKEALYVNLEGRIQKTKFLLNAPSLARVDWKIIVAFKAFFFDQTDTKILQLVPACSSETQPQTLIHVRNRLAQYSPSFRIVEFLNSAPSHMFSDFFSYWHLNYVFRPYFFVYNFIFVNNSKNFYLNNAITRVSKIMGVCAGRYNTRQNNFLK